MVAHIFSIINGTLLEPIVTEACWNWCKEQGLQTQSNIDITNLGVIAIAMVALLLYNISMEWPEKISKSLNLDQEQLKNIAGLLVKFAFFLLAGFLAYYAWFN